MNCRTAIIAAFGVLTSVFWGKNSNRGLGDDYAGPFPRKPVGAFSYKVTLTLMKSGDVRVFAHEFKDDLGMTFWLSNDGRFPRAFKRRNLTVTRT